MVPPLTAAPRGPRAGPRSQGYACTPATPQPSGPSCWDSTLSHGLKQGGPGVISWGAGGPTGGFGTRCPPLSQAGCCRGGKGAASSCEAPTAAFHPLQARGFNLITCFICANLFFNQSCSGRRKEAAVGSFAPSCSKGEVNGSYPGWRCSWGCGPSSPFAGGAWPRAPARINHLFPWHHATRPRFRHRAAWPLHEDAFEIRCFVRILCRQQHAGGPDHGVQLGVQAGLRAGVGIFLPGVSIRSQGNVRVYRAPKTNKVTQRVKCNP